jgi:hypothetical protein
MDMRQFFPFLLASQVTMLLQQQIICTVVLEQMSPVQSLATMLPHSFTPEEKYYIGSNYV